MQDKLQQLTEKLYNEGLSKGKEEAQKMLEQAKAESEKIIADAKKQAAQIRINTEKDCEQMRLKAEGDIMTAARQALSQIRQDIEKSIKMEVVSAPVKEALSSKEFMQNLISAVVSAFGPEKESQPLDMVLPEKMKNQLDGFVSGTLEKSFSKGLEVTYSKDFECGFKISRKGSGYFIDFSDGAFEKIISEYIRPKTRKLIFGE